MGFNVLDTLSKLATESGFAGFFAAGGWQNLVMIVVACVLLYLGIVKGFEPLLLVGIAFGCLLANVSYFPGLDAVSPELNATNAMYHPELWSAFLDSTSPYYHSYGHVLSNAGLLDIFYIGVKAGLYPSLIFMGVGAMTAFGPLIADPKRLLLGAELLRVGVADVHGEHSPGRNDVDGVWLERDAAGGGDGAAAGQLTAAAQEGHNLCRGKPRVRAVCRRCGAGVVLFPLDGNALP